MIPQDKSIDQAILILGVPLAISNEDINKCLYSLNLHPKSTERFNKKGSQEKSTTVKVTFSSKEQKERLLASGIKVFSNLSAWWTSKRTRMLSNASGARVFTTNTGNAKLKGKNASAVEMIIA